MTEIENMSLKELFGLRERLWTDPVAVSAELAAGVAGSVERFMQGEALLARSLADGLLKRVEAMESRVAALETKN